MSVSINLCCCKLFPFFSLRSYFQPWTEQWQILLPQLCLCTLMKDTGGQCSHQHRMPSPFPQGSMSLTPSAAPRKPDGSHSWGKEKEQSLLLHVYSAVQLVRASETQGQEEQEAKQSMRNTGAPQTGNTEPTLNSFFLLVEAKPFAGQQPQSGNCHTASKHFQRIVPVPSDRHRKTAQLKSQHPFILARLKIFPKSSERQLTANATGFNWQHLKTILLRSPSDPATRLTSFLGGFPVSLSTGTPCQASKVLWSWSHWRSPLIPHYNPVLVFPNQCKREMVKYNCGNFNKYL